MEMHQSDFALKDHKFLLETFINDTLKNQISCIKPIKKFFSFNGLNTFLKENPQILELSDAGIAGYICYEGDMEFILFEEIKKISFHNLNPLCLKESFTLSHKNINKKSRNFILDSKLNKYISKIKLCQKYIEEGDIYQANLSEKISHYEKLSDNILEEIYARLKFTNPAPYNAFINYENYSILCSSPESFLKIYPNRNNPKPRSKTKIINQWIIESSPIKGTAELSKKDSLLISDKEKAEHIMIVDLIRNDLSRIAKTGSVKVTELMEIKKFKNLFHLISTIQAYLDKKCLLNIKSIKEKTENKELENSYQIPNLEKIFSCTFPGGSITGTPKIRAMEIINELEKIKRGPYTGSIGYFKFQEGGEFNIIIRSLIYDKLKQELSIHSGAGITSGSNPLDEFNEIQLKAEKLLDIFKDPLGKIFSSNLQNDHQQCL